MELVDIFPNGGFRPRFQTVDSLRTAADEINKPHEDYPDRVPVTQGVLEALTEDYDDARINETLICRIHEIVMWDMHDSCRGKWRPMPVSISGRDAPQPWEIPELIARANLYPFNLADDVDIREWYRIFEEIHPFADGNGRIGGIILSAQSLVKTGEILAPCQ